MRERFRKRLLSKGRGNSVVKWGAKRKKKGIKKVEKDQSMGRGSKKKSAYVREKKDPLGLQGLENCREG